ncbi:MAG TPA: hypothetical protein VGV61_00440 [Thermoanaerobaculia bacterium]|jgi:hypothetical protein|nr:hypothetical protein [Thermoanaerobaculia bacterium]
MSQRNATRLTPWLLLGAFCLTLSTLVLSDRLDAPARVTVEPTPAPMLVLLDR